MSLTLRLDLLRHGETELGGGFRGRLDDALTANGWVQLRAACTPLRPWQVLVSSPLQRCAAFGEELATATGLPLHIEADLRELDFGEWEGRSAAELMDTDSDALTRFWDDPYRYGPPGGEPLAAFEARARAALDRLLQQHAGQHVLVVTHGGVMRLLGALADGLPAQQLMQVGVSHGQCFELQLSGAPGDWQLQRRER
ncbi:MAG: putative phosphoserine phosphatase 2 [Pseudomonas citronellolis]|nr:MAG: putative phosphoserine phosphatase 2 [Pseudomonas citronellolis]